MSGAWTGMRFLGNSVAVALLVMASVLLSSGRLAGADDFDLPISKQLAMTFVHNAAGVIGDIVKGVRNEQEAVKQIRSFIAPISFYPDGTGHFYVYDYNCVNIAHARQKELEGKNLADYQDSRGNFVIRRLAEAAQRGGGFVMSYWNTPGVGREHLRLEYVEPVPGTNYFVGSGVYLPE